MIKLLLIFCLFTLTAFSQDQERLRSKRVNGWIEFDSSPLFTDAWLPKSYCIGDTNVLGQKNGLWNYISSITEKTVVVTSGLYVDDTLEGVWNSVGCKVRFKDTLDVGEIIKYNAKLKVVFDFGYIKYEKGIINSMLVRIAPRKRSYTEIFYVRSDSSVDLINIYTREVYRGKTKYIAIGDGGENYTTIWIDKLPSGMH